MDIRSLKIADPERQEQITPYLDRVLRPGRRESEPARPWQTPWVRRQNWAWRDWASRSPQSWWERGESCTERELEGPSWVFSQILISSCMQENSEDHGKEHWKGFEDVMPSIPPDLEQCMFSPPASKTSEFTEHWQDRVLRWVLTLGKIRWHLVRVMQVGPAPSGQPSPVPEKSSRLEEF